MANSSIADASDQLLGRVAVAAKLISVDQLAQATREQSRSGAEKRLGEVLVELGLITPEKLRRALELQKGVLERAQKKEAQAAESPASAPKVAAAEPTPAPASEIGAETDGQAARAYARTAVAPPTTPREVAPVPAQPRSAASPTGSIPLDRGLDTLLIEAAGRGASDVHLHSGASLYVRVRGRLCEVSDSKITKDDTERLVLPILSADERELLESQGEIDLAYTVKGLARFRLNVYRQLRGLDAAIRRISLQPPTLADLRLPAAFAKFTNFHQGMVLVTGPSSCGKSSTMAALVNLINEERAEHILTVEDPIEYLHPSKRCIVNQRHVKRHTESFARALRAALREDPDVIVVGELRDRETIALAMTAAETGHLVLATLHTDNALRTVNRMIGSFPPDQQEQVRTMLSESLRAVISQRLLPRANGKGMVPAVEVLTMNRAIGNLIRKNETIQIRSMMQTGSAQGMNLLDTSLAQLVKSGEVKREDALLHADEPKLIPNA